MVASAYGPEYVTTYVLRTPRPVIDGPEILTLGDPAFTGIPMRHQLEVQRIQRMQREIRWNSYMKKLNESEPDRFIWDTQIKIIEG